MALLRYDPLHVLLLLLLLLCCCLSSSPPPAAMTAAPLDCFAPDLQALRAFAPHISQASDDYSDYSKSGALEELWGPGDDCCSWQGINCSIPISGGPPRVSSLVLLIFSFSNLSFSSNFLQPLCNLSLLSTLSLEYSYESTMRKFYTHLPACLGDLSALRRLSLWFMNLQGPLPSSFSRLTHLQHLEMPQLDVVPTSTFLSGTLLPISNLSNLIYVDLSGCSLSGSLPPFQAPFLQSLDLTGNFLTSTLLDFTLFSNLPSLAALQLWNNPISGSIPPSIARLSNLRIIILSSTSLSSEIPQSFCTLARLEVWSFSYSNGRFNASLDSLECKFVNLTSLSLVGNGFTGPFPRWVGHSPSLQDLYLSGNSFRGPLPDEWKNLRNLQNLDLSGSSVLQPSQYDTRIPDWLFHSPLYTLVLDSCGLQTQDLLCSTKLSLLNHSLNVLDISNNLLTGRDTLECLSLHNFSKLITLSLSGNPLSIVLSDAILPSWIINYLYLGSCNLKGIDVNRPLSFHFMDLSYNGLAMDLPSLLASLGLSCAGPKNHSSTGIDLSHNSLVGEIPSSLGRCNKALTTIRLHNNFLVGQIPVELGDLAALEVLTLNNNKLKGTIPASIIGINSLILLDLRYNELEGNLNTLFSVSNMTNLRIALLSYNRISGSIPLSFGTFMPNLQLIDFSNNMLTGGIPQKLHLPYLHDLQARDINYSTNLDAMGDLYERLLLMVDGVELSYSYVLKEMTSLDLSSNFLEGEIPAKIGDLTSLMFLNLSHNNLSGPIPSSLSNLSQLQGLDFSSNKLEGLLPIHFSNLTKLSIFNISYNVGLRGSIPQGPQFESSESYKGDPQLCGFPTLQECKPTNNTITQPPQNTSAQLVHRSVLAQWIDEWIALPGLSLGIIVGFGGTLFLIHYKH